MIEVMDFSQKERIYLRDWYYNAGIVGFLKVISDGNLDTDRLKDFGDKLYIGEDYIEFDLSILDNFEEKFYRQIFLKYFDLKQYQTYINTALKDEKNNQANKISKILKEIDKYPFKGLYSFLGYSLETYDDIVNYKEKINELTKEQIYDKVKDTTFATDFIEKATKGIVGISNLNKYLKSARDVSFKLRKNTNKLCISCQIRKREFDLTNAISNIIGFNSDNSNWVWGFDSNKVKLCSICSLIYLCASVSLVFHKKGSNYKYCFYFINHNRSIRKLVDSYNGFQGQVNIKVNNKEIYPIMVKEAVKFVKEEQASQTLQNISFIEIQENNMGGQSTKSYNVYSFSLTKKLAEFIDHNIEKIPKGFYFIKKDYFDIEYEILKKTIERNLNYNDIDKYFRMYFSSKSNNFVKFNSNIYSIVDYILKYISYIFLGGMMDLEKISKKGFVNGKQLRERLGKEKENQINGLAYQFLNDLKVGDRDKFLDKYLRVSISNQMESRFGQDEMNSKEAFLHFGYSFINGLLNTYENNSNKENKNE
ncbi:type I-B CRISPR-associated protein Cas8b1/Cst1 [Desulfurella sp.]|uniref:type I-B CRISPR-associated protein Cas8b1/Cst1 n=2 Tax=Desulfurella sp. TaxID=1962857 RepID=UPI003D133A67